jgi:uroporphyrinogen-III synthase
VKALVIVTRPSTAGERLRQALQGAGFDALWWPAFELGPAPDEARVRATLLRLAEFDLAIFVSPTAVHAVASLLKASWPAATVLGAVGAATASAAREQLDLPADATLIVPSDDGSGGSEAFWEAWQRCGRPARRVLLLRAQHGRNWLAERFAEAGTRVEPLAVYTRRDAVPGPGDLARLRSIAAAHRRVVAVFSSTEAVAALDRQVAGLPHADTWLRAGVAVATHPRICEHLLAAGYRRVEMAGPDDHALVARIESLVLPSATEPPAAPPAALDAD